MRPRRSGARAGGRRVGDDPSRRARTRPDRSIRCAWAPMDASTSATRGRESRTRSIFVSALYDGIAYFSRPLATSRVSRRRCGDRRLRHDLGSLSARDQGAPHHHRRRRTSMGRARWSRRTRSRTRAIRRWSSPDDAHPTWTAPLPAGATTVQVGESDISPAAISGAGDRTRARDGAVRTGAQAAVVLVPRSAVVVPAAHAARAGRDGARAAARGAEGAGARRDRSSPSRRPRSRDGCFSAISVRTRPPDHRSRSTCR